jgi:hypothetical protein
VGPPSEPASESVSESVTVSVSESDSESVSVWESVPDPESPRDDLLPSVIAPLHEVLTSLSSRHGPPDGQVEVCQEPPEHCTQTGLYNPP